MEDGERGPGRTLIGCVAADCRPECVGRQDVGGGEEPGGQGGLARAGSPDQDDEARDGQRDRDRTQVLTSRASGDASWPAPSWSVRMLDPVARAGLSTPSATRRRFS